MKRHQHVFYESPSCSSIAWEYWWNAATHSVSKGITTFSWSAATVNIAYELSNSENHYSWGLSSVCLILGEKRQRLSGTIGPCGIDHGCEDVLSVLRPTKSLLIISAQGTSPWALIYQKAWGGFRTDNTYEINHGQSLLGPQLNEISGDRVR